jgi:hypothetical protein
MASDDKKDDLPGPVRFVRWKLLLPPDGLAGFTVRIPRRDTDETWLAIESSPVPFSVPDEEEKK